MTKKQKQILLNQGDNKIMSMVQSLDNPISRKVLRYRYIEKLEWQEIADIMNYSERHIYRLHDNAIKKLKC